MRVCLCYSLFFLLILGCGQTETTIPTSDVAPEPQVEAITADVVSLADFSQRLGNHPGKIVAVDLWATW